MRLEPLLEDIRKAAAPVLQSQGFELVDLEFRRETQGWVLRVYIDREGGVNIEDCADVSREFGTILEVQDLIPNPYILEISSPGLTRPLRKREDFLKYQNLQAKIKTLRPTDGRRNFKGTLLGMEGDEVRIEVDGQVYGIPLNSIAKANLEFDYSQRGREK